jgi:hypothetical protein
MVEDPQGNLQKILAEPGNDYHQQRYNELRLLEHSRLMEIIEQSNGDFLREQAVEVTPERLKMMADYCLDEFMDIRDVCADFIEMIHHIRDYAATVSVECNIHVMFEEEAVDRILQKSSLTVSSVNDKCQEIFTALDYGLRLIAQKRIDGEIIIPAEGVETPDTFINEVLDENFKL